jgi:polysaccharide biosynthesis/export protein
MSKFWRILCATLCLMCLSLYTVAADTLLGSGDVIKVSVYGHSDLSLETRVSTSGNISFPLIGEVNIGSLSTSNAEKKIAQLLEEKGFIRNPQVNIIVTVMQSQQISILGQVVKPGRYPIDGIHTVTDILAQAGGIGPEGSDTVILIRSKNGKLYKQSISLVDLIHSDDLKQNLPLQADDIIYIERAPKFYIYGEVQHPGSYKLERNMTILQAISSGGGLTPRGTERGIRIKRREKDGSLKVLEVGHDTTVLQDDVVYVQESLF